MRVRASCMDVHTHIHTSMHACIHTQTCIHVYMHTGIKTCMHASVSTCKNAYVQTSVHANTDTCKLRAHTHIHTYLNTYKHKYIHTSIHPSMHTHIQMRTFIERSLEVKLVTYGQMQQQLTEEAEKRMQEERRSKCAKRKFVMFFGFGGSKNGLSLKQLRRHLVRREINMCPRLW